MPNGDEDSSSDEAAGAMETNMKRKKERREGKSMSNRKNNYAMICRPQKIPRSRWKLRGGWRASTTNTPRKIISGKKFVFPG